MRQGQHNQHNKNRRRGRRPGNPANRVYESNGPEVKVRGSAQHVADKYLQLARDAHSSGNLVTAENYFQHAEHYLRIIAAAQPPAPQQPRQPERVNGDSEPATKADADADTNDADQTIDTPGSGPQPDDEAPAPESTGGAGETWDGPQPDFLQRPVEANGTAKPRKYAAAKKPAAEKDVRDSVKTVTESDEADTAAE